MTQLAPDDVPESSTAGTARKARTVTTGEAESLQEAPRTPKHHVALEFEDHRHDLPHDVVTWRVTELTGNRALTHELLGSSRLPRRKTRSATPPASRAGNHHQD
jgi:hypothetical protein